MHSTKRFSRQVTCICVTELLYRLLVQPCMGCSEAITLVYSLGLFCFAQTQCMNPFAAPSPAAGAPRAATDDGAQGGVAGHMAPQHCGPSWLGFAGHCLLHCHLYPTAGSADKAVAQRLQVGASSLEVCCVQMACASRGSACTNQMLGAECGALCVSSFQPTVRG